jgi:hypothetical protein
MVCNLTRICSVSANTEKLSLIYHSVDGEGVGVGEGVDVSVGLSLDRSGRWIEHPHPSDPHPPEYLLSGYDFPDCLINWLYGNQTTWNQRQYASFTFSLADTLVS